MATLQPVSGTHDLLPEVFRGHRHVMDMAAEIALRYGFEEMNVAVMGCIVNGPGESKHADIGISLPGTGEAPTAPVFIDGEKRMTLRGAGIAEEFQGIVEDYVHKRYGGGSSTTDAAE